MSWLSSGVGVSKTGDSVDSNASAFGMKVLEGSEAEDVVAEVVRERFGCTGSSGSGGVGVKAGGFHCLIWET